MVMLEEILKADNVINKDIIPLIKSTIIYVNTIFEIHSIIKKTPTKILYIKPNGKSHLNLTQIRVFFKSAKKNPELYTSLPSDFFNNMSEVMIYLSSVFKTKDLSKSSESDKVIHKNFLLYMDNVYDTAVGPGDAGGAGGGAGALGAGYHSGGFVERAVSRQRRKRNGSPRRKSLKNR